MRALALRFKGNANLGRKLGWRDGAYVGQMISGHRPITEKIIQKAESLQGYRGWFDRSKAQEQAKGMVFEELKPEEKAFLEDFRVLTDNEKVKLAAEVAQRADELREYLQQHSTPAIPLVARPRHAAAAGRKTTEQARAQPLKPADPNQTTLPLEHEGKR